MRKHFLLLFLMALLPLAGWAADISTIWTVTAPSFSYGGTQTITVKQGETAINAENYTVAYYKDNNGSVGEAVTGAITKQDFGKYWVRVSGVVAKGFEGNIDASFQITKGTITVAVKNAAYFVKNYKAADPDAVAYNTTDVVINFSATPNGETIANSVNTGTVTYTYGDNQNANFASDGTTPLTTDDKGYAIEFGGITLKDAAAANYDLKWEDRYMKIKQIVFDASSVWDGTTATGTGYKITEKSGYNVASPFAYDGNHHTTSYEIVWKYGTTADDKITLVEGTDFVLKYSNTTLTQVGDQAINAGAYTVNFGQKTKANFVANATAANNKLGNFEITKGDLTIMVMPRSKTYDGTPFTTEGAQFSVTGWVEKDLAATIPSDKLSVNSTDASALKKDADVYQVHAALADGAIYTRANLAANTQVAWNYNVNVAVPTAWTIKKMVFTLKPKDQTKVYDAVALPDLTAADALVVPVVTPDDPATEADETVTAGAVSTDEANTIKSAMKLAWGVEDEDADTPVTLSATSPIGTYNNGVVLTKLPDDSTDGNGTDKISNAQREVLKNYTIRLENAKLVISGASFKIVPLVAATQYGTPVAPAAVAYNSANAPIEINDEAVAFEYYEGTTKLDAAPTKIGTYTVKIVENPAIATGNYVGGEITYQTGTFSITKKQLTLTVANLSLHKGDTRTTLRKYAKLTNEDGVLEGEKLEYEFDFQAGTNTLAFGTAANDYKLTSDAGTYASAIKATLKSGKNNNGNYDVTFTPGTLTILSTYALTIDETDKQIDDKIADAAITCKNDNTIKYDVALELDRTLTANQWNVLVLPFELNTLNFCTKANSYAIFNVLKDANVTANTVKFGLELEKIPANTPFLVKPQKDIKFKTVTPAVAPATDPTITYLTFNECVIESKANGPVATVSGAKFIGTYKNVKDITGGEYIHYLVGGDFVAALEEDGTAHKFTLKSTRAYLDLTGTGMARPTILVEEADGSTTAIAGIAADGVAVKAEGWYTLSGVKLQSAPTEKGIYINNGKKVVIK